MKTDFEKQMMQIKDLIKKNRIRKLSLPFPYGFGKYAEIAYKEIFERKK